MFLSKSAICKGIAANVTSPLTRSGLTTRSYPRLYFQKSNRTQSTTFKSTRSTKSTEPNKPSEHAPKDTNNTSKDTNKTSNEGNKTSKDTNNATKDTKDTNNATKDTNNATKDTNNATKDSTGEASDAENERRKIYWSTGYTYDPRNNKPNTPDHIYIADIPHDQFGNASLWERMKILKWWFIPPAGRDGGGGMLPPIINLLAFAFAAGMIYLDILAPPTPLQETHRVQALVSKFPNNLSSYQHKNKTETKKRPTTDIKNNTSSGPGLESTLSNGLLSGYTILSHDDEVFADNSQIDPRLELPQKYDSNYNFFEYAIGHKLGLVDSMRDTCLIHPFELENGLYGLKMIDKRPKVDLTFKTSPECINADYESLHRGVIHHAMIIAHMLEQIELMHRHYKLPPFCSSSPIETTPRQKFFQPNNHPLDKTLAQHRADILNHFKILEYQPSLGFMTKPSSSRDPLRIFDSNYPAFPSSPIPVDDHTPLLLHLKTLKVSLGNVLSKFNSGSKIGHAMSKEHLIDNAHIYLGTLDALRSLTENIYQTIHNGQLWLNSTTNEDWQKVFQPHHNNTLELIDQALLQHSPAYRYDTLNLKEHINNGRLDPLVAKVADDVERSGWGTKGALHPFNFSQFQPLYYKALGDLHSILSSTTVNIDNRNKPQNNNDDDGDDPSYKNDKINTSLYAQNENISYLFPFHHNLLWGPSAQFGIATIQPVIDDVISQYDSLISHHKISNNLPSSHSHVRFNKSTSQQSNLSSNTNVVVGGDDNDDDDGVDRIDKYTTRNKQSPIQHPDSIPTLTFSYPASKVRDLRPLVTSSLSTDPLPNDVLEFFKNGKSLPGFDNNNNNTISGHQYIPTTNLIDLTLLCEQYRSNTFGQIQHTDTITNFIGNDNNNTHKKTKHNNNNDMKSSSMTPYELWTRLFYMLEPLGLSSDRFNFKLTQKYSINSHVDSDSSGSISSSQTEIHKLNPRFRGMKDDDGLSVAEEEEILTQGMKRARSRFARWDYCFTHPYYLNVGNLQLYLTTNKLKLDGSGEFKDYDPKNIYQYAANPFTPSPVLFNDNVNVLNPFYARNLLSLPSIPVVSRSKLQTLARRKHHEDGNEIQNI